MFDVYSEINVRYILKYYNVCACCRNKQPAVIKELNISSSLNASTIPTLALKMDFHIKGFLRNRSDYYSDIRNEKNRYLSFKWCNFKTNKIVCVKI